MRDQVRDYYESNHAASSGPRGVENARAMQEMKFAAAGVPTAAPVLSKQQAQGQAGYKVADNYAQQARVVNGRAFYQNGNVWTDATAQNNSSARQQTVRFGSDEYFALIRQDRNLAAWMSLGSDVDVMYNGVLYQIRN
jgi:hypothetical protein